jgi:2-polyprenyl-3-methyl-5-hydroxy-6-metoxy-1,4-benzoquinol methylase
LPANRRAVPFQTKAPRSRLRVLATFGGADAAGLGAKAALTLAGQTELTTTEQPIPNLREQLAGFDLVVTHFGLTAFEALWAGVPVVIVNPTRYHEQLTATAGFFTFGRGTKALAALGIALKDSALYGKIAAQSQTVFEKYFGAWEGSTRESLAAFLACLEPEIPDACPLCKGTRLFSTPVSGRFDGRSYRRCPDCGQFVLERARPPDIAYNADYFGADYKKQYGKTYLEDFPNLRSLAARRLSIIESLLPPPASGVAPGILEVGCAYGALLSVAVPRGWYAAGVDPSGAAVDYVTKTLKLPATQGFFPDAFTVPSGSPARFGAVTLWYVIEHLNDPSAALEKARSLLEPNGVLAFSTPSGAGVSARARLKNFLQNSPQDHRTIWTPAGARRVLRQHGFRVRKVVVTGHHPERFPLLGKKARTGTFLYKALLALSRLLGLGDTFEIYAIAT